MAIDKRSLSEIDICDLYITPAIKKAGWDQTTQIRREVTLTLGPVIVRGNIASRNQRHIAIAKPTGSIDLQFLVWLLTSPLIYDQATRSTTGTAQPTIGLRPLRNFIVPVPPFAEQKRIVAKVDKLMALCDGLEQSLSEAETTRSRLLEALLSEALNDTAATLEAAE